ncbi:MAG: hypothetical protein LBS74_08575 [Oscillospiraceae bacterium]|jgi:hypothetical protein|nr:hypothetical protein [Oscillospiraceae bacterium]
MKKIFTLICLILLLLSLALPAQAAEKGKLSLGAYQGKPKETIQVIIKLEKNPGIIGVRIELSYDESRLELVKAADSELFGKGKSTFSKDLNNSPYILMWIDSLAPANVTKTGSLAVLDFKIKEDAAKGLAAISLNIDAKSTFDYNLNKVAFEAQNGSINVLSSKVEVTTTAGKKAEATTKAAQAATTKAVVQKSTEKAAEGAVNAQNEGSQQAAENGAEGEKLGSQGLAQGASQDGAYVEAAANPEANSEEELAAEEGQAVANEAAKTAAKAKESKSSKNKVSNAVIAAVFLVIISIIGIGFVYYRDKIKNFLEGKKEKKND